MGGLKAGFLLFNIANKKQQTTNISTSMRTTKAQPN